MISLVLMIRSRAWSQRRKDGVSGIPENILLIISNLLQTFSTSSELTPTVFCECKYGTDMSGSRVLKRHGHLGMCQTRIRKRKGVVSYPKPNRFYSALSFRLVLADNRFERYSSLGNLTKTSPAAAGQIGTFPLAVIL